MKKYDNFRRAAWQLAIGFVLVFVGASDRGFGQGGVRPITDEQARSSGPGHPWQGFVPGVNLYSLSKQTTLPLMGWEARGGLPVLFALHHNNQAVFSNPSLGVNWSHSYDTHLDFWTDPNLTRQAALVWGDHTVQRFAFLNNQWVPLDGYRDQLQVNGAGYAVILKSQTSLEFETSSVPGRYRLAHISDANGNALTFDYHQRGRLLEVRDPSGRTLKLSYTHGEKLTSIEFEFEGDKQFSRVWKLEHDADRLARVSYPPVASGANTQTFWPNARTTPMTTSLPSPTAPDKCGSMATTVTGSPSFSRPGIPSSSARRIHAQTQFAPSRTRAAFLQQ